MVCNFPLLFAYVGPPVITDHPSSSNDIPVGSSITLLCRATGPGALVYWWERVLASSGIWTTVSNDNTTSYTTDTTLAIGQYMYRCRVSNKDGSVVSNNAIVNVCGEYCCSMYDINIATSCALNAKGGEFCVDS